MAGRIHKTKGIVLRNIKYGESSIIVSVYTELFGLQSYLLNGIRRVSKKGSVQSGFFQPGALLDLEVYHNELKELNRIREYRWACLYQSIFTDVLKNGVSLYLIELLLKCLKHPESNSGLFAFAEDCLMTLDSCNDKIMSNFPVFFAVHLTYFFGFYPANISEQIWNSDEVFFDMQEGVFTNQRVFHNALLEKKEALFLAELMQARHPEELISMEANAELRHRILEGLEMYYRCHLQDFGKMKTLPVLKELIRPETAFSPK